MDFRLTLFNSITLLIMAVTVLTGLGFVRGRIGRNWPFLYYPLILAYWKAFGGALNSGWVMAGLASALLLRFAPSGVRLLRIVWWVEVAVLGYVLLRCLDLLLGGVLLYYFSTGRFAA